MNSRDALKNSLENIYYSREKKSEIRDELEQFVDFLCIQYNKNPKKIAELYADDNLLSGIASTAYFKLSYDISDIFLLQYGGLGLNINSNFFYNPLDEKISKLEFSKNQLHYAQIRGNSLDNFSFYGNSLYGSIINDFAMKNTKLYHDSGKEIVVLDEAMKSAKIHNNAMQFADVSDRAMGDAVLFDKSLENSLISGRALLKAEATHFSLRSAIVLSEGLNGARISNEALEGAYIRDGALKKSHLLGNCLSESFIDHKSLQEVNIELDKDIVFIKGRAVRGISLKSHPLENSFISLFALLGSSMQYSSIKGNDFILDLEYSNENRHIFQDKLNLKFFGLKEKTKIECEETSKLQAISEI